MLSMFLDKFPIILGTFGGISCDLCGCFTYSFWVLGTKGIIMGSSANTYVVVNHMAELVGHLLASQDRKLGILINL